MTERRLLPQRRASYTVNIHHSNGTTAMDYVVTYSCFGARERGQIAELFVNTNGKVGSAADVMVADGSTAICIALQYGAPVEVLQRAMRRNADGSPMGALGHALDTALADAFDREGRA